MTQEKNEKVSFMSNTVKMIKIIFITGFCAIIAACSSGGSSAEIAGINISGSFQGTIQEGTGVTFDVLFDFAQAETIVDPAVSDTIVAPQATTSGVTFSVTIIRVNNDPFRNSICSGATLAGAGLTISSTSASAPVILTGDGFNATVTGGQISGQVVIDDFEAVEVVDDAGTSVEVECEFGGIINLVRA